MIQSLFLSLLFCASNASAFHVMIDPGHGGVDTGTVHAGLREADLVLKVAHKLQDRLANEAGFIVSMTRENDSTVSLPSRVKKADAAQVDLFLSLHANSEPEGKAKGLEFFFQNSLPPDEEALFLAKLEDQTENSDETKKIDISKRGDVAAIVEDLHRQSRVRSSLKFSQTLASFWRDDEHPPSIKQAPLFVVSHTTMPSVLVEIGFLTHPAEAKKLQTVAYQDELADRLKEAVLRYRAEIASPETGELH